MSSICGACNGTIPKKSYAILCFNCDLWHHIKCVDMTVGQLNTYKRELKKEDGDRWNCPTCARNSVQESQTARKSQQFSLTVDSIQPPVTLEDVMAKLNSMDLQYQEILSKINEQAQSNMILQATVADLSSRVSVVEEKLRRINEGIGNTSSSTDEPTDAGNRLFQEYYDREQRKKNIIIFGLPEEHSMHSAQADKDSVVSTIQSLCPEISSECPVRVFRLGRQVGPKPRPIKVIFDNPALVTNLLKRSPQLKDDRDLRHISITSDKTPMQLQDYRTLKAKLNDRIKAGETDLRIRYIRGVPKIVSTNTHHLK